jgi:hypothetical protein
LSAKSPWGSANEAEVRPRAAASRFISSTKASTEQDRRPLDEGERGRPSRGKEPLVEAGLGILGRSDGRPRV